MNAHLSAAGRAFLRAFGGSLLVFLPGLLEAPNLDQAYALGVAAAIASLAAGIGVLADYVPYLTVTGLLAQANAKLAALVGPALDTALRTFVASLLVLFLEVLNAPSLGDARVILVSGILAAAAAAVRVFADFFTKGAHPAPQKGF